MKDRCGKNGLMYRYLDVNPELDSINKTGGARDEATLRAGSWVHLSIY